MMIRRMDSSKSKLTLLFLIIFASSISSLPTEFSIIDGQETELLSEEKASEIFQKWKEMHGKVYDHAQEEAMRLENFRKSLKYVLEKNSKRRSELDHKVGLNRFADMSNEEFKEVYLSKVKGRNSDVLKFGGEGERRKNMSEGLGNCNAPETLDWREKGIVTPIKDQGQCGSCWAFSVTGAVEAAHALSTGDLISLSEQELVDCDTYDYGCDGGNMDTAFQWIIHNGGIDTEEDYPYTSANGYGGTCIASKKNTIAVSIASYTDVQPAESALLCAVAKQPVTVGIDGSAYDFQLYTEGIYNGECSSSPYSIDHAVLVVGYGSQGGKDYWIAKNSWGTYWGMEGYIFIERNTKIKNGVCGINTQASYPTSSIPAPPGPPPPPSPPSPPHPPPAPVPPPPPSSQCDDFTYCAKSQTCCCIYEFLDICLMYGCCGYTNGICCKGSSYCCPHDYPVCDVYDGYCFKKAGDIVGVAAKKREFAKFRMPWEKVEQTMVEEYQPLVWKRNKFAAVA